VNRLVRDERLCARLAEEVESACRRRARAERRGATDGSVGVPGASSRSGEEVARILADAVGTITGGRFVQVQVGGRVELRVQMPGGRYPLGWGGLSVDVRERLALALRLRLAEAALDSASAPPGPRHVVLDRRPDSFATEAAIAEFVLSVAPRVTQIVVPRAAGRSPPRR
jgi:hypothetical protein